MSAARDRLPFARHYSERLRAIGTDVFGGGDMAQAAFARFEADRDNFDAAFADVSRRWQDSPDWTELAARFSFGAGRLLSFRLQPEQRALWSRLQARAAAASGDKEAEGTAVGELGLALRALGLVEEAIACHRQALAKATERGDSLAAACEQGNIGIAHSVAGRHDEAIVAFEAQLALLGPDEGYAASLARNNLVISLLECGDVDRAIDELGEAKRIATERGDTLLEARLMGNAADILSRGGDRAGAIAAYREQFALGRVIDDPSVEANALIGIALGLEDFGQPDGAERRLVDAVRAARAGHDRHAEAIALINLARLLARRSAVGDAIRAAGQALGWYRAIGDGFADEIEQMMAEWSELR